MAALLLVAAVGGAVGVRSMDVGVGDESIEPLPEDLARTYDVAASNTANASHRAITTLVNVTNESAGPVRIARSAIDYADRQRRQTLYRRGEVDVDGYFSESLLATWTTFDPGFLTSGLEPLTRRVGNWSITTAPGYGVVQSGGPHRLPSAKLNWSVHDVNESAITYRIDDADELAAADLYQSAGGEELSADSYAVAVVDRQRAVVETVRLHYEWTDTGVEHDYVRRYNAVGSTDLTRPVAFGPRRPLEYVWDALYY